MKNAVVSDEQSHMLCFMHGNGSLDAAALSRLLEQSDSKFVDESVENSMIHGLCAHEVTDRVFVCLSITGSDKSRHKLIVACVACSEKSTVNQKINGSVVWAMDVLEACDGLEEDIYHDGPFQCIVSLSPADDTICLGMSSGHIVAIELDSDVNPLSVEEVGDIEGGVSAMAWSPDGEMVALVGGFGQCLLMTSCWDVLMETHVFRIDCTDPQPTAAPERDAIEVCEMDDPKAWFVMHGALSQRDASISWRGDSKYLATVVRRSPDSPGRVRVWDVEAQDLHSLGEQSPGTLAVLAWQPQGRVLCVANFLGVDQEEEVQVLRQMTGEEGEQGQAPEVRHVGAWKRELKRRQEAAKRLGSDSWGPNRVFLYERNGLQHGEFIIPGSSNTVIEGMEWSTDSQTLAIVLRDKEEDQMSVQVWCRSNWKWYNKFTRTFKNVDDVHIIWQDTLNGTYLCMLTSLGLLSKVCLSWGYTSSSYGTIAVVDGASLMVTPMRQCMIPPPMCAVTLFCGKPVTSVDFTVVEAREVIGALLADGRLAIVGCNYKDEWESMIENEDSDIDEISEIDLAGIKPTITNPCGHGEIQYRHFAWLDETSAVLVGQSPQGIDSVIELKVDIFSGNTELENEIQFDSRISMISSNHLGRVLLEFEDGSCKYYFTRGDLYEAPGFDSRCDSIFYDIRGPIGLDKNGKLFVNSVVVASDVTSFGIHAKSSGGPHLLYTSRSNFIRAIPLESVISNGMSQVKPGDVSIRAIEEGCKIACCPSESVDVILQAPRGNLEIIRPRALVLPAITEALDKKDYKEAWNLATVNRLDLNILPDYQWPSFLENIEAFMLAVDSDVEFSGFLQSLSSQSVLSKTGIYSGVISTDVEEITDKVNACCETVGSYIQCLQEDAERRNWLCTELTSHTKRGNIGKALLRVKEIKENDLDIINNQGFDQFPKISAESGLKHILLHNPENDVYNAALQEYELELAYMVVTHSQRDPGEYLAQLQEFATVENPCIRKASIDCHLGRYSLALEHLHEAGSEFFPEALSLAKDHGLLRHLLNLVEDQDKKAVIYKALGESLSAKGKYEDAALSFIAGKDLEQALRAYRLAGAWKPAMTLAIRLGKDKNAIKDIATRLVNDLDDAQKYEEAAQLTLEYLQNVPNAVRLYANAGNWREGLRVATTLGSLEMVNSILAPVAASAAERLLESFKDDMDRVNKYWMRLRELRERRKAMEALKEAADAEATILHDGKADYDDQETASMMTDMSIYTDASLATTAASGTSFATTIGGRRGLKNDKHKKKKKNKIRQGSPEEEAQLAKHILSLLPLPEVCTETGQLSEFLVFIGHEDDATILQRSLKNLIDNQEEAAKDILSNPPPGQSFELPYETREEIFNKAGLQILNTIDASISRHACPDLQMQIKDAERSMRNVHWKWEVLRDP